MPRHGENIRKRSDGRWEGRIKTAPDSRKKCQYKSIYGKTYSEVKSKMLNYIRQGDSPNDKAGQMTLGELLKQWLSLNHFKHKASTEIKYEFLINKHIIPAIGNRQLSEINALVINRFLSEKLRAGRLDGKGELSPAYVRTIGIIIGSVLEFGAKEKLCTMPAIRDLIPKTSSASPTILTKSHQRILENYLFSQPDLTNLGILLTLRTGLRIGEVCALRWNSIHLSEKELSVKGTVIRVKNHDNKTEYRVDVPKTKSSCRLIPITDDLYQMLVLFEPKNKNCFLLSGTEKLVHPPTFSYRYHRILKELKITDINYHALRHTFATRCIEAGMDEKSLSEILGHANVSITLNTYVHPSMELKRERLAKLITVLSD